MGLDASVVGGGLWRVLWRKKELGLNLLDDLLAVLHGSIATERRTGETQTTHK